MSLKSLSVKGSRITGRRISYQEWSACTVAERAKEGERKEKPQSEKGSGPGVKSDTELQYKVKKGNDPRNDTNSHQKAGLFVEFRVLSWIVSVLSFDCDPVLQGEIEIDKA
jgi:hypothetical protein